MRQVGRGQEVHRQSEVRAGPQVLCDPILSSHTVVSSSLGDREGLIAKSWRELIWGAEVRGMEDVGLIECSTAFVQ